MYQSSFHPSAKLALRLVALASAICCVGTANAQPSGSGVTLYGIADVGVTQVTGLKAGTVTQVSSGIMDGSRWGIRGNEDMGGGYRTIFTRESRVELTNGSQTNRPVSGSQLSDRYSQAGLLGLPSALQPAVNAVDSLIAQGFGVSDLIIGLTIVAVGTSLPELASSLIAVRKGEHDIALGNVIGSNLFNTLAVVGIAGVINPLGGLPSEIFWRDIMVMAAVTLALFAMCFGITGKAGRINRLEGSGLLLVFVAYTAYLISTVFAA